MSVIDIICKKVIIILKSTTFDLYIHKKHDVFV